MKKLKKYEQVAAEIKHRIELGLLQGGGKIPSIRMMAEQMRVSIMTVLEGYRMLEEDGIIESVPQSGYFVRARELRQHTSLQRLPEASRETIDLHTDFVHLNPSIEKMLNEARDLIPLGAGLPDPRFLESEELSVRMARVVRSDPFAANRYSLGKGEPGLRKELAKRMIDIGCTCGADDIIVTAGATQALLISLRAVAASGDTVAIESPGFQGFYSLIEFLGLKVIEIPCDPLLGFSVSSLKKAIGQGEKIAAVLLSSTFSNPTGSMLPDWKKELLAHLCADNGIAVIDDDTYGNLSFGKRRPLPLKAFDPDNVIHIGNMSKILAPGYRIGWVEGGKYSHDIMRCHFMAVLAVATPNQMAVAAFLKAGGLKHHLRKLRKIYAENMQLFQHAVAADFPWGTCTSNPEGGHFLWVRLPDGCDSDKLALESARHGISIAQGTVFTSRKHYRNFIRLNTAVPWTPEIRQALKTLGDLVKSC